MDVVKLMVVAVKSTLVWGINENLPETAMEKACLFGIK
jgi:hypothetical protein